MDHVWCPATINIDVPITSGLCLVSMYYTQWYTEHLWVMFGVHVLYTVIYRTLMAHVWCPCTIQWSTHHFWLMFGVHVLYTVIYRTLMADIWCPGTIHSDVPITSGSCLVSSYYTQWSTEHSVAYAQGPPTANLITWLSHHQTSLSFITYLILFCWSHQWIHIYLFVSLLQVPLCT